MSVRDRLLASTTRPASFAPKPAMTDANVDDRSPLSVEETIRAFDVLIDKPAPLTFQFAVSADMAPGFASFAKMENGEMKVLWVGPLAALPDWPAGAKLWLHRSDYDRLCREVPGR